MIKIIENSAKQRPSVQQLALKLKTIQKFFFFFASIKVVWILETKTILFCI